MALGRCHGNLDTHPGCYHPGPGVLPVWASDLFGWVVFLAALGFVGYIVWKARG